MSSFISIENGVTVEHITLDDEKLPIIQSKVICSADGCNKVFSQSSALRLHYTQCHLHTTLKPIPKKENFETWYHCPVNSCIYNTSAKVNGKHFAKAKYVKQHYLKVHAARNIACEKCGKSFSTKSFLNAHLNSCSLDITCSCGRDFGSIEALQVHVKRLGHVSEVLNTYLNRKKKSRSESQNQIEIQNRKSSCVSRPVLPKPEPPHISAAIALSELALAGIRRASTVDVGIQTDIPHKKSSKKSWNVSCIRKPHLSSQKRKQTIEMETQTRLTNLEKKCKFSKKSNARTTSSTATFTDLKAPSYESSAIGTESPIPKYLIYEKHGSLEGLIHFNEECTNGFHRGFSTSSTQTSPRSSFRILMSEKKGFQMNILPNSVNFDSKNSIVKIDNEFCDQKNNFELVNVHKSPITDFSLKEQPQHNFSTEMILDEDDNLIPIDTNTGEISELLNSSMVRQRPPTLSQIRSSSIETQTDHDVFLSTNVDHNDEYDNILVSSQPETVDVGLWCTSETQTCEDFSDIEQYLCSTIHTQTPQSASELFPELNFTDTQTQTGLHHDSPSFTTTHTQTSIFGMGNQCD